MIRTIGLLLIGCVALESRCRAASQAAPSVVMTAPPVRLIVALRDTTRSYCCTAKGNQKLEEAVKLGLGPNDRLVLIDIGPRFSPKQNVRIVAEMPRMVPMRRDSGLRGDQEMIRHLSLLLERAEGRKKPVLDYLKRPAAEPPDGTDLYAALEYAARLLEADKATEKYLVILSDLEHDFDGLRSTLPPAVGYRWGATGVTALFVPYGRDWDRRKAAWDRWFRDGGATSFDMWDEAMSQVRPLFPPNEARRLVFRLTR